ncbi:sugar phosphate nucleotidyltransferase [Nisaea sp.]|uniref:sugar phosphate nucleotidyltransferase n=1 Tax=Nisaea sp. TaxID=2024842 RepID=UPI003B51E109
MSNSDQAVILVGGKGTRLSAITRSTPKPLLKVGGIPFLEHLLLRCMHYGFAQVILLSGHLHEQIDQYARDFSRRRPGISVKTISESVPLGTAGGLKQIAPHLAETFLMMNGDSIFDFPWNQLESEISSDAIGIVGLRTIEDSSRYGSVQLDGRKIREFAEKPAAGSNTMINGGVYYFRRQILDFIGTGPQSLEHDVFPPLVAARRLDGTVKVGHFIDIGVPDDFSKAQTLVPAWTRELGLDFLRSSV